MRITVLRLLPLLPFTYENSVSQQLSEQLGPL